MLGRGNGIQCHNYAHGKCNVSHYIKLEYIDKMIVDKIKSDVEAQNFRTILIPENAAENQEMQDNKRALERARKKLARVKEAYENGIDTIEEYRQNKARIQMEIEELEAKPAPPRPASPDTLISSERNPGICGRKAAAAYPVKRCTSGIRCTGRAEKRHAPHVCQQDRI